MGEESYFIDALSRQLASTILTEAEQAFNQITVYGRDTEAGQVVNLCRQMPMMGSREVIVVKEAQQMRGLDKLALYTAKPSPTTVLVICHKEKTVDKRSQLYKTCLSGGRVLESVRPRDYEIGSWLTQHVAARGCTIDRKALAMLIDHLGTDLSKIANELTKLLVSLPEGARRIADTDIERHIGISKDYNNFELCRAVARQDAAPRPDHRRPLRPQPQRTPPAGYDAGPLLPVPGAVPAQLPALAEPAPRGSRCPATGS